MQTVEWGYEQLVLPSNRNYYNAMKMLAVQLSDFLSIISRIRRMNMKKILLNQPISLQDLISTVVFETLGYIWTKFCSKELLCPNYLLCRYNNPYRAKRSQETVICQAYISFNIILWWWRTVVFITYRSAQLIRAFLLWFTASSWQGS